MAKMYNTISIKDFHRKQGVAEVITYDIVSDKDNKLKTTTKIACNFWNRFIIPKASIIIRLGIFESESRIIARAYKPYSNNNVIYGLVEFNTKYLDKFSDYAIAGTIIHEIAHTLGLGWDKWRELFWQLDGTFKADFIRQIPELQHMRVETDYGPGTQYSHWDEDRFDKELMTGFKDNSEYVLPVTIKVMGLLGHTVIENLIKKTDLKLLMSDALNVIFSREEDIEKLDKSYVVVTEIMEEIDY